MKMRRFIGAAAAMAVAGTLTVGAAQKLIMLISVSRQHPTHLETLLMTLHMVRTLQTASTSTA